MSYLKRLSIRGIRSFDPENEEDIRFYSPLTIIIGPNGAGKTTIIEALRYATTGEAPPNSNRGKTFVHDPAVAKNNLIRGQVRLKFHAMSNEDIVITRSLEVQVKKTPRGQQLAFKTLNSVIKRQDGQNLDSRCAVIDTEVLDFVGVTKAVLTNVIFCHQDDSNWPLSDGKILKEKFDDIFGSMGFVKALDKIKKLRKTEKDNEKLLFAHVENAKEIREQYVNNKNKLDQLNNELVMLKKNNNCVDEQLEKITADLNSLRSKEDSLQGLQNKISTLEGIIQEKNNSCKDTKKNIKNLFQGTREELQEKIDNFLVTIKDEEIKKQSLEDKLKQKEQDCQECNKLQQKIIQRLGKLEESKNQHDKYVGERNKLALEFLNNSDVNPNSTVSPNCQINEDNIMEIDSMIIDCLKKLDSQFEKEKVIHSKKEEELQRKIDEAAKKENKIEGEKEREQNNLDDKEQALEEINKKLLLANTADDRYKIVNDNLRDCLNEINQMQQKNIKEIENLVKSREREKQQLKIEINEIEDSIKTYNQESNDRIKYDYYIKNKKEKEKKLNQLKLIHSSNMKQLDVNETNGFSSVLDKFIKKSEKSYEKITLSFNKKEKLISEKNARLDLDKDLLNKKKNELNELKINIKKYCKIEDFDNYYDSIENDLKDLRESLADLESSKTFYQKQISSINTDNCCPLCERETANQWNTKYNTKMNKNLLIKKLKEHLIELPDLIKEKTSLLEGKENLFQELILIKPKTSLLNILENEISKLEETIRDNEQEIKQLNDEIESEKVILTNKKIEIENMRKLSHDASEYDSCISEIQQIDYQINQISWKISSSNVDINDLFNQKKAKQEELERKELENNKDNKLIRDHQEKLHKLQYAKQEAENEKLKIERDQREKVQYEKKKEEIEKEIVDIRGKLKSLDKDLAKIRPQLEYLKDDKKDERTRFQEKETVMQNKISQLKERYNEFRRLNAKIEEYMKSGKQDELNELNTSYEQNKTNISSWEAQKKILTEEINKISDIIRNNDLFKRELDDNMKVFEYQSQIKGLEKELDKVRKSLGFHDITALKKEKANLEQEERKLYSEKQQSIGKQKPIINQIREIEQNLKNEKFKNSETKFKERLIDLTTCIFAGEDLNKYYKALDYAVTTFHTRKMQEINKLIQGFWKQAYRGQDIDYIKIVSDEEEERTADKRRTYNYRVVMVKDDIEMDMRGRCSAGQKVLASLIIRLALAEIFCANCSVLALDEPTTNLDKDNIASFSRAITDIVKYRSKTRDTNKNTNFQLIIITHDHEFLNCLEEDQQYYKVYKDSNGHSKIKLNKKRPSNEGHISDSE